MGERLQELIHNDLTWMRKAVDLAKRCESEVGKRSPKVAAVAVRDGELLGSAYRGQRSPGAHAEYCLLEELVSQGVDPAGATIYTTLEPCTSRGEGKVPCADRLVEAAVGLVFIGVYDPDPRVYRAGWAKLRDAGIAVRDFDASLRAEIATDMNDFISKYRHASGDHGEARFDYSQNNGEFLLIAEDAAAQFKTRWTPKGADSIYAYDANNNVAHARYARHLGDIDDPSALAFDSHSQPVRVGEVVVFRGDHGFALIRLTSVLAGPDRGHDRTEISFEYELRLHDDAPR